MPNGTPLPHGVAGCDGNQTVICDAGWANANGIVDDGCEASVGGGSPEICDGIDNDNNGVIDDNVTVPPVPNGTAACRSGQLVIASCNAGFADADQLFADGCEMVADSFEPNNTMGSARLMQWGSYQNLNLVPMTDLDYYLFTPGTCSIFQACGVHFSVSGSGVVMDVFRDGAQVAGGVPFFDQTGMTQSHTFVVLVRAAALGPPAAVYQLDASTA